jgi:histidinol-phosphate/aromatic aminotransferase/cobyric acid decarboxylase-like protein
MTTRRSSRVFTVSFPAPLAKQVEQTARKQNRTISELFRESWRAYKFNQYEQLLMTLRQPANPSAKVVTQDEIEAFVDKVRSENYRRKQSKK